MKVTVDVKLNDAWKKALQKVQTTEVKGVIIGIVEKTTNEVTGANIAEYAFYNEFGTRHIHARPFMRMTAEKNMRRWAQMFVQITGDKIIKDPGVMKNALTTIGKAGRNDMIDMIMSNIPPDNSEATQAKKRAKKNFKQGAYTGTLYDTGEMAQSIWWRVVTNAAELEG